MMSGFFFMLLVVLFYFNGCDGFFLKSLPKIYIYIYHNICVYGKKLCECLLTEWAWHLNQFWEIVGSLKFLPCLSVELSAVSLRIK